MKIKVNPESGILKNFIRDQVATEIDESEIIRNVKNSFEYNDSDIYLSDLIFHIKREAN